jgi:hypothetical protein
MKKLLAVFLLILSFSAYAQIPALNDIVRNNTLTPAKVANALDGSKGVTASGTNTYTISTGYNPYVGSATYAVGDIFTITFTNANSSGTVTINVDSEGAIALKDDEGNDLSVGALKAGGTYQFRYNGTNFRQVGGSGGGSGSTPTLQQVLTAGSTLTGTNTISGDVINIEAVNGASYKAQSNAGIEIDAFGNVDIQYNGLEVNGDPGGAGEFLSPSGWATPAGGAVSSVFTRTGAVTAQSGDYTAAQVTGAITGPASATDNAIVRYDATTGKLVQNSGAIVTDGGDLQLGTLEAVSVSPDTSHFYGTSITAGTNASVTTKRYAYLVAQGLQTIENNHGLGGYSLQKPVGYGGSSFMNVYQANIKVKSAFAKYLFFAWGENDANNEQLGVSGFDTVQFKTDYQTVINYAITKGWSASNIIIISPFFFATTVTPLAMQQKYVRAARTIATTNGLKYIEDVFNTGNTYGIYILAGDGKHPNDYGMSLYGNVILQSMKAFNNVKNNSQKIAVNSAVSEFQEVKIRNMDAAADNAQVVAYNSDGKLTKYAPDRFIKALGADPGTGFRNTSNIWNEGLIYSGSVVRGNTGAFTGASWAYNNSLLSSSTDYLMLGVSSSFGYIWCFNGTTHRSIKIAELAGNLLVGTTTDVSGVKLQVTGRAAFTTQSRFGSNAQGTAKVHIDASTTASGTGQIKLAEGTQLSVAEDGNINYINNNLEFTEGTTIHILPKTLTGSGTIDFGSIGSQGELTSNITVTGTADGDKVVLGWTNAAEAVGVIYTARGSATNTVTIKASNTTLAPVDPGSGTFKVSVIKD